MVTCFNAFSCQRVYVAGLIPLGDYIRELRNASQNCSFGDVCYTWECAKSVDSSRVLHDMKMGNTPLRTWCYMNTCRAPHLKISPKHFSPKHFTVAISIALSSASEQTRCFWYHVMLNDQLALPKAALFNFFYNIHWLVVTWLVPHGTAGILAYTLCTLYSHAPVYSIIFLFRSHICRVHVCLAVSCQPVLGAAWPWSFKCYCSDTGVSTKGWPWRRQFSCHSQCRDLNLWPFDHESGTPPLSYPGSLMSSGQERG